MSQPPNQRSHKVLAAIEIIDKLNFCQEDLDDLTGYLAARCGLNLSPDGFTVSELVQLRSLLDQQSDLVEPNPVIYSDEKSTITVADCYPCPISGKPCPTNGAMGEISHYYYPGDCPNFKACADTATEADPCNCGKTYNNACDGDCPELSDDIMNIPLEGDFLEDHLEDIAAIFGINIDQDSLETPDY